MAMAQWKASALPKQGTANLIDLQTNARTFYNNRFDILDNMIQSYQSQKSRGELSDRQFIEKLQNLANKKRAGGYTEQVKAVEDLGQQSEEAIAKQVYNDYIEAQKRNLQNTINAAEVKFSLVQDDFEKGKINLDQYRAQRDAYLAMKKNAANMDAFLPKYSFDQFKYGSALNTYQSGRMRDTERERQIRDAFKSNFGYDIDGNKLYELAGSYLPTEYLAKTFQQQKLAKVPKTDYGSLDQSFKMREQKYTFPGTGGRSQAPGENYARRNYYGVR